MHVNRELYINGELMHIDESTAIGVDFEFLNIADPIKKNVKVSNAFSIPSTEHNLNALGFANDLASSSNIVYDTIDASYLIDGLPLFLNKRAYINNISSRIELMLVSKGDLFDELGTVKWNDFFPLFINYLTAKYGLPNIVNYEIGSFTSSYQAEYDANMQKHTQGSTGLIYHYCLSGLFDVMPSSYFPFHYNTAYLEEWHVNNEYPNTLNGGRWCFFVKDLIEFIEVTFACNFGTGASFAYNFWNDSKTKNILCNEANLIYSFKTQTTSIDNILYHSYFEYINTYFGELDVTLTREDKTIKDFILDFVKEYGIIIEPVDTLETREYRFYNYNDLYAYAPIIDLSLGFSEITGFKPFSPKYGQKTYIKYAEVPEGLSDYYGGKEIICNNKNIEATGEIGELKSFFPSSRGNALGYIDMSSSSAINNFVFFDKTDGISTTRITTSSKDFYMIAGVVLSYPEISSHFFITEIQKHSVNNEYTLLDIISAYPKYYKIKNWLTFDQVSKLKNFQLVYINQLGGCFIINKIKSMNLGKSKEPTELELTFVNFRTPYEGTPQSTYVDISSNHYIDESANFYSW